MTVEQDAVCPLHRPSVPEYVGYAHMDRLHELVQPRTDSPREVVFLLVSHVKELMFRVAYVELDQARTQMRADRIDQACLALDRAAQSLRVLVQTWDLLASMSPDEFLVFRHILGQASGTQSFMYRTLEFSLGNKDPRMVSAAEDQLALYPQLRQELAARTVYDEALGLLSRQGLDIPAPVLHRDSSAQYRPDPAVELAWRAAYEDPARWPGVHRIAEQLMEVAFRFSHWRASHLLVVERMLGDKPGTGGTSGVSWLREINEHRFFPELWSVRTSL
ncbi:tryptophan 2,3-dioxygenase [Nocardia terpenica]|uniref:Tryptophan 2,3-dioxygenase n=1 Tax=Nocardia terpenica TaxID=455432 RepID=A0A6G9YYM9_9NOCA|nr:tryptophan 2,3-dioxygenase family protein [Nocardia terpenica]QIS18324.1 tryptophan 2,3-dioxygenase [Nocardia terpenica]